MLKTKKAFYQKGAHIFFNITDSQIDYTLGDFKLELSDLPRGAKLIGILVFDLIFDI